ncbi:Cytochrome c oxidase subunit 3 [Datura stramonium]|uniref:Cytochrome c oxidase subunit 3 n=1 Tax=Datura stramonium TaxID=4076 RepID=A0ABS8WLM1_DATST|nr:Cytochrome c oxidase subunit 3 [Datura stramonium]
MSSSWPKKDSAFGRATRWCGDMTRLKACGSFAFFLRTRTIACREEAQRTGVLDHVSETQLNVDIMAARTAVLPDSKSGLRGFPVSQPGNRDKWEGKTNGYRFGLLRFTAPSIPRVSRNGILSSTPSLFRIVFVVLPFLSSGFHGFHVIIGTIFSIICGIRQYLGHLTKEHHVSFDSLPHGRLAAYASSRLKDFSKLNCECEKSRGDGINSIELGFYGC